MKKTARSWNSTLRPGKGLKRTAMKRKNRRSVTDAKHRMAVILRWGPWCKWCGRLADEVSHLRPKGTYPELRCEILNTLPTCRCCHERWHRWSNEKRAAWIEAHMPACLETFVNAKRGGKSARSES